MRSMAWGLPAVLVALVVTAFPLRAEQSTSAAEEHIRKACESVWTKASPHQIERCTKRAMAALADENRLRDNELKRLLVDSERELDTCRKELDRAQDRLDRLEVEVAVARRDRDPR